MFFVLENISRVVVSHQLILSLNKLLSGVDSQTKDCTRLQVNVNTNGLESDVGH